MHFDDISDDILVFSKSEEDHKKHLRVLFGRLSDYGVIVNSQKCVLCTTEVKFLGFLVSSEAPAHHRNASTPYGSIHCQNLCGDYAGFWEW